MEFEIFVDVFPDLILFTGFLLAMGISQSVLLLRLRDCGDNRSLEKYTPCMFNWVPFIFFWILGGLYVSFLQCGFVGPLPCFFSLHQNAVLHCWAGVSLSCYDFLLLRLGAFVHEISLIFLWALFEYIIPDYPSPDIDLVLEFTFLGFVDAGKFHPA